ncbi:metalloregulator ArsR/SmtB family transcription factor [Aquimarina sp. 2201CG1-2-11]|uniref:ArsR/SmtB family transcription factor n=1 Tax=Aquimarina discodermiae TaxID=3231043 RepID=UPI003462A3E8
MNILEISKVLSNQVRIDILDWLKTPENNFPKQTNVPDFSDGVCVCHIQEKTGLSQSTVSHYLGLMHRVNLVIPTRHGKWTYYKRNEEMIQHYINTLKKEL